MNIFKELMEASQDVCPLTIDRSCTNDFWDYKNERSLSIEDAVAEGYFATVDEAEEYKAWLEDDEF